MRKAGPISRDAGDLRQQAERRLAKKRQTAPLRPASESDMLALVHELQVHQIELEMQNAELLTAQAKAQEAQDRYVDLFDFAPVGYFLLDPETTILEINLAGAAMLGLDRSQAVRKRFGQFIAQADRTTFSEFCQRVFTSDARQSCEIRLDCSGKPLDVLIEAIVARDDEGHLLAGEPRCRVAVIDLSDTRRAEEELRARTPSSSLSWTQSLWCRRDSVGT